MAVIFYKKRMFISHNRGTAFSKPSNKLNFFKINYLDHPKQYLDTNHDRLVYRAL